jgi:hypothetical protein
MLGQLRWVENGYKIRVSSGNPSEARADRRRGRRGLSQRLNLQPRAAGGHTSWSAGDASRLPGAKVGEHGEYAPVRVFLWIEVELQEDLLHVGFHRPLGNEEAAGDRTVRESFRNEA